MKLKMCALAVLGAIVTATPVRAISMGEIATNCVWIGNNGELTKQECSIHGDSSAGQGTTFRIQWADGMTTTIKAAPGSSRFSTGTRMAELHGNLVYGRAGFPRQIHLKGLGIIVLTYENVEDEY
jgi:hypothetical protein